MYAPQPVPASTAPPPDVGPCALKQFCFGPMFTLGVANLIGLGAHARYGSYVGFGLDYQFTPEFGIDDVDFSLSLFTVDARLYPTGGALFLSAGFAYQIFSADAAITIEGLGNVSASGSAGVPLLKLGIGLLGHDGFVMGIDVALEIPLGSANVELDSQKPTGEAELAAYNQLKGDIQDVADDVLSFLPFLLQLNLIRIGYLF